jgi:hypothetical protein
MKDKFERPEKQSCVEPTDPVEMLYYKESLDEDSKLKARFKRRGLLPRWLAEAVRASLTRWRRDARIWLHRLTTRLSTRASLGRDSHDSS